MVAEMLGVEAYRPNGTYFGGVNPYGTYTPSIMNTVPMIGTNNLNCVSAVQGTIPSAFGNIGGVTRTTAYTPQLNDDAEDEMLKGHVEDLKFILEKEWDEEEFKKQWKQFRDAYKESGTYQSKINNKKAEYMAAGKNETEAESLAKKYGDAIIFDSLKTIFNRKSGIDLKEQIRSHFWWDSNFQKFLKNLKQ